MGGQAGLGEAVVLQGLLNDLLLNMQRGGGGGGNRRSAFFFAILSEGGGAVAFDKIIGTHSGILPAIFAAATCPATFTAFSPG